MRLGGPWHDFKPTIGIMRALWSILGLRLKSRVRIEAENLALRRQLNVVYRSAIPSIYISYSETELSMDQVD